MGAFYFPTGATYFFIGCITFLKGCIFKSYCWECLIHPAGEPFPSISPKEKGTAVAMPMILLYSDNRSVFEKNLDIILSVDGQALNQCPQ